MICSGSDKEGPSWIGERLLWPAFSPRDGVRFDADASLLPVTLAA
jgi:hypothetical protein